MGIVPPKEIEDIVQETYVRACQSSGSENIKSPRSFMYKTARNLALDHVKRAEYRLVDQIEDDELLGWPNTRIQSNETYDEACTNEEFAMFCEAVRNLPVKCRRAFVLKKVYGYSQKEIAASLQVSEKTVEKHIASGIKRCSLFMSAQTTKPGTSSQLRDQSQRQQK